LFVILDILTAFFTLGIPVFLITWYLLRRLYRTGKLEQGVSFEALKNQLKGIKQSSKEEEKSDDFLHRNWMKFGGGFYGITAVATLILIEIADLFSFIKDFPGTAALLENGLISLLVDFIINQIENFLTSILWFAHWGDGAGGIIIWALVAYGCYYLGTRASERSIEEWQSWGNWRQKRKEPD
jgi:hypothetical protein